MSIIEINSGIRSIILMLGIISLVISVLSVVINLCYQRSKKGIASSVIIHAVCVINFVAVYEINRSINYDMIKNLSFISRAVGEFPFYIFGVTAILFGILAVVQMYLVYVYHKTNISVFSIKEGLENMKSGITFYAKNGSLILTNKAMFDIYFELTGKDLQDGKELENDLKTAKNRLISIEKNGNLCFELHGGKIWQFSKTIVPIFNTQCIKIEADDIKEVCKLNKNVENLNSRLEKERERLKDNLKEIEKVISEEEVLKVKMSVHDDFGKLIALTSRMYRDDNIGDERGNIALQWENLANKMQGILTFDKMEELALMSIKEFAKQLKCNLEISGKIEENARFAPIVLHGIFEFLKNAVHHANAKVVSVESEKKGNETSVKCSSENTKGIAVIKEGGGLSNLRREVEKQQGKMEVSCGKNIQLEMIFSDDKKEWKNA